MGSFGNFFELVCLDLLFAATTYIGLKTGDPLDDNSGGTEPTDPTGAYERITSIAGDWEAAAAGEIKNDEIQEFAESSAAWSTGATPLTHFIIMDAITGGNMLAHGSLTTPRAVNTSGIVLRFPVGELVVALD
ncbi:hypothetical protein LCGC14_1373760 [marine sediment metagenome]|uniref:Uncharacterized protein n=1 Tax=marine sediment metagenome TaxID=412755 RepID=A0A0F9K4Z3_9ZZZZ